MADDLQVVNSKAAEPAATPATTSGDASDVVDTIAPTKQPGWLTRVEQARPEDHPVFGPVLQALQKGLQAYHQLPGAQAAATGVSPEAYQKAQEEHDARRPEWMKGLTDEGKWYNQPFARFREGMDRMTQDLHDYAETHKAVLTPAAYAMLHGVAAAGEMVPVGRSAAETAMAVVPPPELGGEARQMLDVNDVHQAAKAAGVEYRGLQEGIPGKVDDLLIFQDPKSGTSVGVKRSEFTPEKLTEHVENARARMAPKPATLTYQPPEDLVTRAKRLYGATLDHEALANGERAMGFYLPDGSFVGRPTAKDSEDFTHHRIAAEIMGEPDAQALPVSAQASKMRQFMDEAGAVRMHNAEGEANVQTGSQRPTPEQVESIAKLAKASSGKVVWDLGHDKPTYGEGTMGDFQRALDQRYGPEKTVMRQPPATSRATPPGETSALPERGLPPELHVELEKQAGRRLTPAEAVALDRANREVPQEGADETSAIRAAKREELEKKPTLAQRYIDLHNAAAKEYKEAFNSVGAKMWRDDEAHPIKKEQHDFINGEMERLKGQGDKVGEVYGMTRPLTVLDSYPNVSEANRNILEQKVNAIHDKYSALWGQELSGKKPTTLTYKLPGAPAHVLTHEWGHATVAAAHGFPVHDIVGPGHPALPQLAQAGARIDIPELTVTEEGATLTDTARLPQILEIAAGGAAAEELAGGPRWHENQGFTGDGDLMYELLRTAGFDADQSTHLMDQYVQKAKGTLNHAKLKGLTPPEETGTLMPGQLVSGKTMQAHVNEVRRRLYGEGHDAGGAEGLPQRGQEAQPAGKAEAAGAAPRGAALTYKKPSAKSVDDYFKPGEEDTFGGASYDRDIVERIAKRNGLKIKKEYVEGDEETGIPIRSIVIPHDLVAYHTGPAGIKVLEPRSGDYGGSTNLTGSFYQKTHIGEGGELGEGEDNFHLYRVVVPKGTKISTTDPNWDGFEVNQDSADHFHVFKELSNVQDLGPLELKKVGKYLQGHLNNQPLAKLNFKNLKLRQNVADNETMADPDTRFNAARHEAGHAVISELTRPGSVNNVSLDERGGLTEIQNPPGVTSPAGLNPDQVKDLVAMSYAGGLQEPGGTTAKHVSSDTKVREKLLGPQGLAANEDMAAARARINALLADPANRQKIDQVAQALNERGKLTGDEVRNLLRP